MGIPVWIVCIFILLGLHQIIQHLETIITLLGK
jgi:hypothetical protein